MTLTSDSSGSLTAFSYPVRSIALLYQAATALYATLNDGHHLIHDSHSKLAVATGRQTAGDTEGLHMCMGAKSKQKAKKSLL